MSTVMPLMKDAPRLAGTHPGPLGVGFAYFGSLPAEMYRSDLIDFVELTPETLCNERSGPDGKALVLVQPRLEQALATCGTLPMVVHGVELSIGSAHGWNTSYLRMLDQLQEQWPFRWHSEHLNFQTYQDTTGAEIQIGTPLPLPMTEEVAELVSARSARVLQRYGVPFLLENPAHYLTDLPVEPDIPDEYALMDRITSTSGCGQLLDLHNLYCNAVNHGFDPFDGVGRYPLDRVVEIHVAGGRWEHGYWTDAHCGATPEPVWDLLEYVLPKCPHVAAVVFEMLEPYATQLGVSVIARNLERARGVWASHQRRCG